MLRPKVYAEPVVRDAVTAVAAALLPSAVVGFPVLRAMLLPGMLLGALSFLCVPRLFVAPLFGMLCLVRTVVPILLVRLLLRFVLVRPRLLLVVLWFVLPSL
jgi:hypothetical protein